LNKKFREPNKDIVVSKGRLHNLTEWSSNQLKLTLLFFVLKIRTAALWISVIIHIHTPVERAMLSLLYPLHLS